MPDRAFRRPWSSLERLALAGLNGNVVEPDSHFEPLEFGAQPDGDFFAIEPRVLKKASYSRGSRYATASCTRVRELALRLGVADGAGLRSCL